MRQLKIIFIVLTVAWLNIFAIGNAYATSGACSSHGGVNCSAGSQYDGTVICNDGWLGSSVQYSSMIECQGSSTVGSSIYQYLTADQICQQQFGDSAKEAPNQPGYCVCLDGFAFDENNQCVSRQSLCIKQYGENGMFNGATNVCGCMDGYTVFNGLCISRNLVCQYKYGANSVADIRTKDSCQCEYNYTFNVDKTACMWMDIASPSVVIPNVDIGSSLMTQQQTGIVQPKFFVGAPKSRMDLANCSVVGNISTHLYYRRGSAYIKYASYKGKVCFIDEEAAKKVKYRKSKLSK